MLPLNPDQEQQNPMVTIQWDDEQITKLRGEIQRANTRRKVFETAWQKNIDAYVPDPSNTKWGEDVNPGVDFYQVEQKKDQLFFDTPFVILTPDPLTVVQPPPPPGAPPPPNDPTMQTPAIQAHQALLNQLLGRRKLDVKRLADKVLFDVLCPSGCGWTKIGYTNITKSTQIPRPSPYTPLGQPTPEPEMQAVDVPIFEEFFWERFSPKKGLIPNSYHDTEFDKAPWLGEKFQMPLRVAKRTYQLPDDFNPKSSSTAQVFAHPGITADEDEEQVSGEELWYKASLFDDNEAHPQKIRQIVFIDGLADPVVHRDSPYQTFGPDGKLTPDSMIGFPIHPCTIRDLADSAYVPSDCTITRPLVNELARFRTQLIEQRDSSTSVRIADENIVTPEVINKVIRSPWGAILPIAGFDPARPPMMELVRPTYPRESFQAQETIERDIAKVNSMSANQTGTQQDTVRSATELTYVQQNSNVRLQAERNRFLAWFLAGVQKLDALVQRYPEQGAQPGAPPQSAPLGRYTYDIKPDSGVHVDSETDLKRFTALYNMLAKDPNINRMELHKAMLPLARLDPTKLLVQPPPRGPEPPKITTIVRGEDLSPLSPQYDNVVQMLGQLGIKLQPTPVTPDLMHNAAQQQAAQQPVHLGPPVGADVVSKHTTDHSGSTPNFGGLAGKGAA